MIPKLLEEQIERMENEIAWRQCFLDEVFGLVWFAEEPFTMTKHYKELKEICQRYGMDSKK